MGPWYSPYRDGPDPELVLRKRQEIKCRAIMEQTAKLRESFLRLGNMARVYGEKISAAMIDASPVRGEKLTAAR